MLINILSIVIGIVLVLWGADRLTDGSVAVAERLGIPQIVIGLTIVAMGTSMPEFCSSLVSALNHQPGMAVGNVVGSNIFNALLIVGAAAVVAPISILWSSVKKTFLSLSSHQCCSSFSAVSTERFSATMPPYCWFSSASSCI